MEVVEVWYLSVVAVAASMERTAAVMSQCALCMSERSRDVKDFDASLTCNIVASKSGGDGAAAAKNYTIKLILIFMQQFQVVDK